jgi:hypothetical protein
VRAFTHYAKGNFVYGTPTPVLRQHDVVSKLFAWQSGVVHPFSLYKVLFISYKAQNMWKTCKDQDKSLKEMMAGARRKAARKKELNAARVCSESRQLTTVLRSDSRA